MRCAALLFVSCIVLKSTFASDHAAPAKPQSAEEAKAEAAAIWADLLEGNKRFVAGTCQTRPVVDQRKTLAKGQKPKVVVLACADSRVAPELVFDKSLGELFVIRIAGNIADKTALGSIEYAVEHLDSKLIVVLGHEKCGAVAAAASSEEMPSNNLKELMKKIRPALKQLKTDAKGDELYMAQIHANAKHSAQDLLKNSEILKKAVASNRITVVPAVYKLESGEVAKTE